VNFGKTAFSEAYPDAWLYLMGGTFIAVVMFFPDGLAGLAERAGVLKQKLLGWFSKDKPTAETISVTQTPVSASATEIPTQAK